MADLALRWGVASADLALEAGDLARDDGLETAIAISLFTDRRAEDGDPLPDGEGDRRGWWGDAVPVIDGDRIGSRLWLLAREKQAATVLRRAEEYAREALAWLLEDRVADRIDVAAEMPRAGLLGLVVTVHRPQAEPVQYRFNHTWDAQARRG